MSTSPVRPTAPLWGSSAVYALRMRDMLLLVLLLAILGGCVDTFSNPFNDPDRTRYNGEIGGIDVECIDIKVSAYRDWAEWVCRPFFIAPKEAE